MTRSKSIMNATLLESEIPGLRDRVKRKLTTPYQEADRYGVGVETIRRAVRGETFRNVREGLPEGVEPTVKNYGRRKDDVVSAEDAKKSLERFIEDTPTPPADPVEDFLQRRKEQTNGE
jgi:hypothetical protein